MPFVTSLSQAERILCPVILVVCFICISHKRKSIIDINIGIDMATLNGLAVDKTYRVYLSLSVSVYRVSTKCVILHDSRRYILRNSNESTRNKKNRHEQDEKKKNMNLFALQVSNYFESNMWNVNIISIFPLPFLRFFFVYLFLTHFVSEEQNSVRQGNIFFDIIIMFLL